MTLVDKEISLRLRLFSYLLVSSYGLDDQKSHLIETSSILVRKL